jgi:hypothetical protein
MMANLITWQPRTIARLEASLFNREPESLLWNPELDPDSAGSPDQTNAWIHDKYREKP